VITVIVESTHVKREPGGMAGGSPPATTRGQGVRRVTRKETLRNRTRPRSKARCPSSAGIVRCGQQRASPPSPRTPTEKTRRAPRITVCIPRRQIQNREQHWNSSEQRKYPRDDFRRHERKRFSSDDRPRRGTKSQGRRRSRTRTRRKRADQAPEHGREHHRVIRPVRRAASRQDRDRPRRPSR